MFETTVWYKSSNERAIFEDYPEYYDSALISGHHLAHSSRALPQLIADLAEERGFSYYIDPMIGDFRVGENFRSESGSVRSWYGELVDEFGNPIESLLEGQENINPVRLNDDQIEEIARLAVDFQEDFVYRQLDEDVGKYEDPNVSREDVRPAAIIPWRHILTRDEDFEAYRKILAASEERAIVDLKPLIYTTARVAAEANRRMQMVNLLNSFDVDECFLLIEDLDKYSTTQPDYENAIDLVYDLNEHGIQPHFFYGDFFANLLSYFGLGGTCHGTLHGEEFAESYERPGDGGMQNRFYLNEVKGFVQIAAAVELMTQLDKPMCDCEFCQRKFDNWTDIADADQDEDVALQTLLMKHRVAVRWNHAELVENQDLAEVLGEIKDHFNEFSLTYNTSRQVADRKSLNYLPRWIHAVQERMELLD